MDLLLNLEFPDLWRVQITQQDKEVPRSVKKPKKKPNSICKKDQEEIKSSIKNRKIQERNYGNRIQQKLKLARKKELKFRKEKKIREKEQLKKETNTPTPGNIANYYDDRINSIKEQISIYKNKHLVYEKEIKKVICKQIVSEFSKEKKNRKKLSTDTTKKSIVICDERKN